MKKAQAPAMKRPDADLLALRGILEELGRIEDLDEKQIAEVIFRRNGAASTYTMDLKTRHGPRKVDGISHPAALDLYRICRILDEAPELRLKHVSDLESAHRFSTTLLWQVIERNGASWDLATRGSEDLARAHPDRSALTKAQRNAYLVVCPLRFREALKAYLKAKVGRPVYTGEEEAEVAASEGEKEGEAPNAAAPASTGTPAAEAPPAPTPTPLEQVWVFFAELELTREAAGGITLLPDAARGLERWLRSAINLHGGMPALERASEATIAKALNIMQKTPGFKETILKLGRTGTPGG